jgi:hypothetical protein
MEVGKMSIEALSWAFNLDLPSSGAKLTLLALANYSNESGEAYPSQKAMAIKTCLCERAIRTHLATLESLGIISRVSRKRENGSFTTDLFRLNIGAVSSGRICQRQNLPAAESAKTQRQIFPNPAAESAGHESPLTTTVTKTKKDQKHCAIASRLPEDWEPSDDDIAFCKTKRPDLNVRDVADEFRDYWVSVAGAKGKKQDWPATWRNWVRRQNARASPAKKERFDPTEFVNRGRKSTDGGNDGFINGEARRVA